MTITNHGPVTWGAQRDDEGHRTYTITFRVEGNPGTSGSSIDGDGPEEVTTASGLPKVGDNWSYGTDNDPWSFCSPFIKIDPYDSGQKTQFWNLSYKFTTKPWTDPGGGGGTGGRGARLSFCSEGQIQNPLMEPDVIRGSFVYGSKKVTRDKAGFPIKTRSHELVEVEIDENLPTVEIGQNVSDLDLPTFTAMVNRVNSNEMWGMDPRQIKLSNASWERRLYGICGFYYHRTFVFDINPDTFDFKSIPNKGKKMIFGEWEHIAEGLFVYVVNPSANRLNPLHYKEAYDHEGKPTEYFLDNTGAPTDEQRFLHSGRVGMDEDGEVEYTGDFQRVTVYKEANFLTLGIPATLG